MYRKQHQIAQGLPLILSRLAHIGAIGVLLLFHYTIQAQPVRSGSFAYHKAQRMLAYASFDSANYYYSLALEEGKKARDPGFQLNCLNGLALTSLEFSSFDSCKNYLSLAQQLLSRNPSIADSAKAGTHLLEARYHLTLDQYDQARTAFEKALPFQSKSIPVALRAEIQQFYGYLLIRETRFTEALKYLELALSQQGLTSTQQGIIHGLLGICYQENRDWDQTKSHYEEAVSLLEASLPPRNPKLAMAYLRLGLIRQIKGDNEEAERLYLLARDIQQQSLPADHFDRVLCYSYLGFFNGRKGDHGQALYYFQQALRIVRFHMGEQHRLVASNANNAGNALLKLGRYQEASSNIEKAVQIFEKIFGPTHPRVASAYLSLGLSYFNTAKYQEAINAYNKTISIRTALLGPDHQSLPEVFNNRGMCYFAQKKYQLAIQDFGEAVRIGLAKKDWYDASLARYHNNIGNAYRESGELENALNWHQKAIMHLAAGFKEPDPSINPSLTNIANKQVMLEVLTGKARSYQLYAGEHPEFLSIALTNYQLAADNIDSLRQDFIHDDSKFRLAEAALPVFEGAISCAYQLYQQNPDPALLEEAFMLSEKSKAVLLLQSIKDVHARKFAQIPDSLLSREKVFASTITRLQERLFKARFNEQEKDSIQIEKWRDELFSFTQKQDSLSRMIELNYPDYHRLRYASSSLSMEGLRSDLAIRDLALVEYFVGNEEMSIFYVSGSDAHWLHFALPDSLSERLSTFRTALDAGLSPRSSQQDTLLVQIGYSLYQDLVSPLFEKVPQSKKRWTIIPDGILGYLPFDALLCERPQAFRQYKDYCFLLSRKQISYSYSATILQEMWQPSESAKETLIAFAPVFSGGDSITQNYGPQREGFSPLSHTLKEVEAVRKIMGGTVLQGKSATEQNFYQLAPNYRIIHLASHARLNDENPLYSQIAFSPSSDSTYDGLVTVAELFNIHLSADMIVLSACETGIGKLYRGEGIASQARGFAYAGARSIITTLWSINDAASAEIIPVFYQYLQNGLPKDAALRQAKLDYLQKTDNFGAHPFFWAAFVPIGDMAALNDSKSFWYWGLSLLIILIGLGWYWRKKRFSP